MSLRERARVLEDLVELGCTALVIHGGNPFIDPETCLNVCMLARRCRFSTILVITNGTLLTEPLLDILAEQNIQVIVPVFSHVAGIHDAITGRNGSYNELDRTLNRLLNRKITLSFTLLVLEANQFGLRETRQYFQAYSPKRVFLDYLYPSATGCMEDVPIASANDMATKRNSLMETGVREFFDRCQFHSCMNGIVAVTMDGFVLPCPAMRNEIIGDLRTHTLHSLFVDRKFDKYWKMTKDKFPYCRQCEFRYACHDCRAMHAATTGKLEGIAYCSYDPIRGLWCDAVDLENMYALSKSDRRLESFGEQAER